MKSCIGLFTATLFPLLVPVLQAYQPVVPAQQGETISHLPVITTTGQQWSRHRFRIATDDTSQAQLSVAVAGVASVYLNGQQLVRNHKADEKRLTWPIGRLIRNGDNCLAIATATETPAALNVQFTLNSSNKLSPGSWKTTTTTPPVGWQQTDFNDRDWTAATVATTKPDIMKLPAETLTWTHPGQSRHFADGRLQLRTSDHVVLLGATFIERAQSFGHLESVLTAMAGEQNITFRNLGWSADTVFAESRGIFDSPAKGYERMIELIRAEEPTVILVCYGQNEAMSFPAGVAGIEKFKAQLAVLQRDLAAAGAEVIFLSPHPFLPVEAPLPNPTRWNARIKDFADAVHEFADSTGCGFVDLYSNLVQDIAAVHAYHSTASPMPSDLIEHSELQAARNAAWTHNGMHWNDVGYERVAHVVGSRLFDRPLAPQTIQIDAGQQSITSDSGQIRHIKWSTGNETLVSFQYQPGFVSSVPLEIQFSGDPTPEKLSIVETTADQTTAPFIRTSDADEATTSTLRFQASSQPDYAVLQSLTIRKNELYFFRWRPQNITYLFGFRKHEQGNNASEIAQFDPLIDELEEQIRAAKQPQWKTVAVSITK